jgi:membrane protease YdiL (CAAX protease family)
MALGYLALNLDAVPSTDDVDALVNFVLEIFVNTLMPTMILCSIIFILIYVIHRKVMHKPLQLCAVNWKKLLFFAEVSLVLNVILNTALTVVEGLMPSSWLESLDQSVGMVSTGQPMWLLLLGTGILIPIMEELTFRYGLHGNIARSNVTVAYIVSSVIFGLVHGNPIQIVYAALFGFVLAFVYQKTGNIWYPIIMHIGNNTSSLIATDMHLLVYIVIFVTAGLLLMIATYNSSGVKLDFLPKNTENTGTDISNNYTSM